MKSHGTGLPPWEFREKGERCVFEQSALVFHPENIIIGNDVYVGHQAILKGYFKNEMRIGSGTWIGQQAFIHSAGGVEIGEKVGIGPGARIISSTHRMQQAPNTEPIMDQPLVFAKVVVRDGCDIGVNATVLPGVELARFTQIAAGAVVTRSVEKEGLTVGGVPARPL